MTKPKLRPIKSEPSTQRGQVGILLSDPLGISKRTVFVPGNLTVLLSLLDGTREKRTIQAGYELRTGRYLDTATLEGFVSELDEALYLQNERFDGRYKEALSEYRAAPSRPAVMAGLCYPPAEDKLSAFLGRYFEQVNDERNEETGAGDIKGLISPHIDFLRGGLSYARVWSRARDALMQAELIVILGTDHNADESLVTPTRQSYKTPWGVLPTDKDTVDRLAERIGEGAFTCELNHKSEHSIEAAIIWLHYLLNGKPCPLLPVLCGSFAAFIERNEEPADASHIAAATDTLRNVAARKRVLFVAAADLAHQGPAFGDSFPLGLGAKADMSRQDKELMEAINSGSSEEFFRVIKGERDSRHVCGVPPIYMTLAALSGVRGETVSYEQCPAAEDGTSLVSICGVVFKGVEA